MRNTGSYGSASIIFFGLGVISIIFSIIDGDRFNSDGEFVTYTSLLVNSLILFIIAIILFFIDIEQQRKARIKENKRQALLKKIISEQEEEKIKREMEQVALTLNGIFDDCLEPDIDKVIDEQSKLAMRKALEDL